MLQGCAILLGPILRGNIPELRWHEEIELWFSNEMEQER